MSLTGKATQNLISNLEKEAMESIGEIIKRRYGRLEEKKQKQEVLESFFKERAELELQAIRADLGAVGDQKAIASEMWWAKEDMKSPRVPAFLRSTFQDHYDKCYQLTLPSDSGSVAVESQF